jgi:asparagine synthase (glutamine-hydrolysing)
MCGIAGFINFSDTPADPAIVSSMTEAMAHRGPNANGIFADQELVLGHRRLSIIDLSTAANQPFTDASGRYVMVFNGEVYNYRDIRAELKDYPFKTTSDTEVLLAAYIQWKEEVMARLRGMYAFAIWDTQRRELFIGRDRMGIKPLYYYHTDECLIFASELRAILASGKVPRKLNRSALAEYLSYQSAGMPNSMIEGVQQLEAGHWMRLKGRQLEDHAYWSITDTGKYIDFDFNDKRVVQQQIRTLMQNAVASRMVGDVPMGAFLSGGIDSSAIVGLMAEASAVPVNTFNVSFKEAAFDEAKYAKLVAEKFNTRHTNIQLTPGVLLDELENALDAMDTPSGDGINTYVVSKAIRDAGITVALSGIGGDELFGGYPIFAQYLKLKKNKQLFEGTNWIRNLSGNLIFRGNSSTRNERMKQILKAPNTGIEYLYPIFREIISPDLINTITNCRINSIYDTSLATALASRKEELARLPLISQVSAAEYLGYTQHTLLKDADQMSMAVSLEVREPFFDYKLVEFVMAVPDELKLGDYPKQLLVDSLQPLIPDEVVFRKKQGFTFPWESWMKHELKAFCSYHIRGLANRSFINAKALMSYWNQFLLEEKSVRWAEIWLLVVLGYWLEKNDIDA